MKSARLTLCNVACPVCQSVEYKVFLPASEDLSIAAHDFACTNGGHGKYFQIVECAHCQMRFCSPRPSAESLTQLYSEVEDVVYAENEAGRIRTARSALRHINKTGKRLLDVGCGTGVFLHVARDAGYDVTGIEPSIDSSRRAREKGLSIMQGTITDSELEFHEPFDIITMWDVLEHVDSPAEFLSRGASLLREGGELHLSTIFVDSSYATMLGKHWPWYMLMHIHYFRKEHIERLLLDAGFSKVEYHRYWHTVSLAYLTQKIACLLPIFSYIAPLFSFVGRNIYIPISFGDISHVKAIK